MLPHVKGVRLPKPPWSEFTIDEVLIYYDVPRMLLQKSDKGQLFLAWWHDEDAPVERWIYLPVSEERLRAILSGNMADRYAMDNPEDGYILVVDMDWNKDAVVQTIKTTTAALQQDALPHPDVRLDLPMPDGVVGFESGNVVNGAEVSNGFSTLDGEPGVRAPQAD